MRWLLEGRTVAVVGRAGSLLRAENGAAIDAADVVIRVNWVLPIPPEQEKHVGSRTDLMFHCKRAKAATLSAKKAGIPTYRVRGKARRRAAKRHFRNAARLRPTTGYMAILSALTHGAREVWPFGFDFFRSGHVQEREPDGDDYSKPLAWLHSPSEERRAMKALIAREPRLRPDPILEEALR